MKLVTVSYLVCRFIIWSAPEVSESCKWTLKVECQFAAVIDLNCGNIYGVFCTDKATREEKC